MVGILSLVQAASFGSAESPLLVWLEPGPGAGNWKLETGRRPAARPSYSLLLEMMPERRDLSGRPVWFGTALVIVS